MLRVSAKYFLMMLPRRLRQKKYYGKGSAYMRIFKANREVIKDPDKIYLGQKIRIPLD